jgi:hypothetical protein
VLLDPPAGSTTPVSRSSLYFFAAVMFLIAALAWGLSGQGIGFALLVLVAAMLALGIHERGRPT